ncbi:disintegrin and metalloproteinase domain-containing protein 10-like [Watersipora subatra]|uniref:disintegrin and metalloproteinase domain-containing protein 10-like n=1 Tax=Watersipora subatra TaxID=2589382 RepID=UPI00355B8611
MHCPLHVFIDHRFFEQLGQSNIAGKYYDISNNIGFIIARITLFKDEQANPMSHVQDGEEAQVFLNAFTAIDHSKYCLGVMFTVVDFSEGVLGLAWIASENSLDAGICSTPYRFRNGSTLSFNSAIVSARNYGNVIPTPMFTITLVHELGHNFGAEHDNKSRYSCAPDGDDGNYIMYELSGDGSHPNHFVFSTCSTNLMYRVLLGRMPVCFQERYIAICGNFRIDHLCVIQLQECVRTVCDLHPEAQKEILQEGREEPLQYATLNLAIQQTPEEWDNLKMQVIFVGLYQVCINGKCSENVCTYHGYKSCYCTGSENDCLVCCRHNTTGECKPAALWGFNAGIEGAIPTNGICIDESGRCDENGLCRFPNGSYAKDDIIRLVKESAKDFIVLLSEYWYYALLSLAGVCGLVALFTFIHRSTKPVQSMAYKDGRMAYVWFEARSRLASIEAELKALEKYVPPTSLPYPIAIRRIAYQFPTAPHSLYSRYMVQCEREREVVKLLLLKGYPMRKLLTDENDERHEQKAIDKTLAHKK